MKNQSDCDKSKLVTTQLLLNELQLSNIKLKTQIKLLEKQLAMLKSSQSANGQLPVLKRKLAQVEALVSGLRKDKSDLENKFEATKSEFAIKVEKAVRDEKRKLASQLADVQGDLAVAQASTRQLASQLAAVQR